MPKAFDELQFEPHNGYGSIDMDGDPWPFGYIGTSPAPMPVFELNVVLKYPVADLRKLALAMAAAPEMLRVLKYLYDEAGPALPTPFQPHQRRHRNGGGLEMSPYHPPRKAHDIHSICPWCGAEKSSACEFGDGDLCPWTGDEPEPEPAFSSPVPDCAVWIRRPTHYSEKTDAE